MVPPHGTRGHRLIDEGESSSQSSTSFLSSRATEHSSGVFVTPPANPTSTASRPHPLTPFTPIASSSNTVPEVPATTAMTFSLRSPSNPSNPGSLLATEGERRKQVVSFTNFAEVVTTRSGREVNMASLLAALPDDETEDGDAAEGDTVSEFYFRVAPDMACNPLCLPLDSLHERSTTESIRSVPLTDALTPHAAQLATRHF